MTPRGGHDASLPVTDDHDLLCRTYLAGVKFVHPPRCLYFYRLLEEPRQHFPAAQRRDPAAAAADIQYLRTG